jgi:hypothetical protein
MSQNLNTVFGVAAAAILAGLVYYHGAQKELTSEKNRFGSCWCFTIKSKNLFVFLKGNLKRKNETLPVAD